MPAARSRGCLPACCCCAACPRLAEVLQGRLPLLLAGPCRPGGGPPAAAPRLLGSGVCVAAIAGHHARGRILLFSACCYLFARVSTQQAAAQRRLRQLLPLLGRRWRGVLLLVLGAAGREGDVLLLAPHLHLPPQSSEQRRGPLDHI